MGRRSPQRALPFGIEEGRAGVFLRSPPPEGGLKRLAQNLGLLLLSVTITFVFLEVAFRLLGYQPIYQFYSRPEILWQYDPVLGWRQEPNTEETYVGPRPWPVEFQARVKINSIGLRGPEVGAPPAGGWRILALGDSVVAGFEVPYEKTFTALLQVMLTTDLRLPVQVINAGIRGYGTDQTFLLYRDRLRSLHPDIVLFFHSENDPLDNVELHRMRRRFGKAGLSPSHDGGLKLVGAPVPNFPFCSEYRLSPSYQVERVDSLKDRLLCRIETGLSDHSSLFTCVTNWLQKNEEFFRSLYRQSTHDQLEGEQDYAMDLTRRIIGELAESVTREGSSFLLLVSSEKELARLGTKPLSEAGIEVLCWQSVDDGAPAATHWKNDSHLNELGHRRMAEFLARTLEPKMKGATGRRPSKPGAGGSVPSTPD